MGFPERLWNAGCPSKDGCWKAGCLGQVGQGWLVAGHRAKSSFAEGKMKCGRRAGQLLAKQAGDAVTKKGEEKKKKAAKRGTRKENLPTRELILAASMTTLTARWQLC